MNAGSTFLCLLYCVCPCICVMTALGTGYNLSPEVLACLFVELCIFFIMIYILSTNG